MPGSGYIEKIIIYNQTPRLEGIMKFFIKLSQYLSILETKRSFMTTSSQIELKNFALEWARLQNYRPLTHHDMEWNDCRAVYRAPLDRSKHVRFHDMVKLNVNPDGLRTLTQVFLDANERLSNQYGFEVIKFHGPTLNAALASFKHSIDNAKKKEKPPRTYCVDIKYEKQVCTVFIPIDVLALTLGKETAEEVAAKVYKHHIDSEVQLNNVIDLEAYDAGRAEARLKKLALKHEKKESSAPSKEEKPKRKIGRKLHKGKIETLGNQPDLFE
ncbi:MAG: hypothetical protein U1E36_03940 [Rickettsiales bacterium]